MLVNDIKSDEGTVGWRCDLDADEVCDGCCVKYDCSLEDVIVCKNFLIVE